MNFFEQAFEWHQQQRDLHTSSEILLGYTRGSATPLRATVSQNDGLTQKGRTDIQSQIFHFIVKRSDLVDNQIKIQRGIGIWYKDNHFEVIFDRSDMYEYNDPMMLDVVLKAILKKENDAIVPTDKLS